MKTKNHCKTRIFYILIALSVSILICFYPLSIIANDFDGHTLTIDASFTSGSLGDTIESIHSNLSEIKSLDIRAGTVNNNDILWVRDNLPNLFGFTIWEEGNLQNNSLTESAFLNHKNIRSFYFKNLSEIGNRAFKGCTNLSGISSTQLTHIGDSAFAECSSLWKLSVNETNPPTVGTGTFYGCNNYRQIRLPYNGKNIYKAVNDGNVSDNYWYGFELLVPHENVVEIFTDFATGQLSDIVSAFRNELSVITSLHINKGELNSTDVYWIRDNLPNLDFLAINGDATFTNDNFPNDALKNHKTLRLANISTATTIGNSSFEGCSSLTNVSISSATSIGNNAFKGCSSCVQLYVNPFIPPSAGTGTFDGCSAKNRVVDLYYSNGSNCDPDMYKAVNDGNTADNFWHGWEIKACSPTTIVAEIDKGGNIGWGQATTWDTIYENNTGAIFWNEKDWDANDKYAHYYFVNSSFGGLRRGNYSGINYQIPPEPTTSIGRIIWGYHILIEEYTYTIDAIDGGQYSYQGLKYVINQPDGNSITACSRGNGNGTDSAYFDILVEDPSPGLTKISEGGIISDFTGFTTESAFSTPLIDSLVMGRMVTKELKNGHNRYFFDMYGGFEMSGKSYILSTHFMPPSTTIEKYEIAKTYVSEFGIHFKNDEGQLESFKISPLLISETYSPATAISNQKVNFNNTHTVLLYPNPVSEKLFFKANNNFSDVEVKIYNLSGALVFQQKRINTNSMDVSNLSPGVYQLFLKQNNSQFTNRFIKL